VTTAINGFASDKIEQKTSNLGRDNAEWNRLNLGTIIMGVFHSKYHSACPDPVLLV